MSLSLQCTERIEKLRKKKLVGEAIKKICNLSIAEVNVNKYVVMNTLMLM